MKKMKRLTALATWTTALILAGTSHGALIIFQQGLANDFTGAGVYMGVENNILNEQSPSVNYGGATSGVFSGVRPSGQVFRTIMRFNLGGLPEGSTVTGDATVKIKATASIASINNNIAVYEVLGANGSWEGATSTWNWLDKEPPEAKTDWAGTPGLSKSGTDYNGTQMGSDISDTANGFMEFTISQALVQSWIDTPSSNSGLLFKLVDETAELTNQFNGAYLSDTALVVDRPSLEVSVIPEPSTLLLFLSASVLVIFSLHRKNHATSC